MGKRLMIIACLMSYSSIAQKEVYIRAGLLNSALTYSPSLMLNRSESNYYVTGFLQGRLDKHLSFRGETHYLAGSSVKHSYFKLSSRTFFGLQYGVSKGNLDTYIGFMPGFTIAQVHRDFNEKGKNPVHFAPSFSANIGTTYYIWKVFNVFANVTYVHSTIRGMSTAINGRSDELMISAGLGFNVNAVRAK